MLVVTDTVAHETKHAEPASVAETRSKKLRAAHARAIDERKHVRSETQAAPAQLTPEVTLMSMPVASMPAAPSVLLHTPEQPPLHSAMLQQQQRPQQHQQLQYQQQQTMLVPRAIPALTSSRLASPLAQRVDTAVDDPSPRAKQIISLADTLLTQLLSPTVSTSHSPPVLLEPVVEPILSTCHDCVFSKLSSGALDTHTKDYLSQACFRMHAYIPPCDDTSETAASSLSPVLADTAADTPPPPPVGTTELDTFQSPHDEQKEDDIATDYYYSHEETELQHMHFVLFVLWHVLKIHLRDARQRIHAIYHWTARSRGRYAIGIHLGFRTLAAHYLTHTLSYAASVRRQCRTLDEVELLLPVLEPACALAQAYTQDAVFFAYDEPEPEYSQECFQLLRACLLFLCSEAARGSSGCAIDMDGGDGWQWLRSAAGADLLNTHSVPEDIAQARCLWDERLREVDDVYARAVGHMYVRTYPRSVDWSGYLSTLEMHAAEDEEEKQQQQQQQQLGIISNKNTETRELNGIHTDPMFTTHEPSTHSDDGSTEAYSPHSSFDMLHLLHSPHQKTPQARLFVTRISERDAAPWRTFQCLSGAHAWRDSDATDSEDTKTPPPAECLDIVHDVTRLGWTMQIAWYAELVRIHMGQSQSREAWTAVNRGLSLCMELFLSLQHGETVCDRLESRAATRVLYRLLMRELPAVQEHMRILQISNPALLDNAALVEREEEEIEGVAEYSLPGLDLQFTMCDSHSGRVIHERKSTR